MDIQRARVLLAVKKLAAQVKLRFLLMDMGMENALCFRNLDVSILSNFVNMQQRLETRVLSYITDDSRSKLADICLGTEFSSG